MLMMRDGKQTERCLRGRDDEERPGGDEDKRRGEEARGRGRFGGSVDEEQPSGVGHHSKFPQPAHHLFQADTDTDNETRTLVPFNLRSVQPTQ